MSERRRTRLEQAFDVPPDVIDVELDLSLSISSKSILASNGACVQIFRSRVEVRPVPRTKAHACRAPLTHLSSTTARGTRFASRSSERDPSAHAAHFGSRPSSHRSKPSSHRSKP